LKGSELNTTHAGVPKLVVEIYLRRNDASEVEPANNGDEKIIVEGTHRYVAGRVAGQESAQTAGTLSSSPVGKVQAVQNLRIDPLDWGNR
jgi:hypothetical protein